LNEVHHADAELVRLPSGDVLAVTTDSIVEEIAFGFYPEPETVGWVGATAALSDLAAVAALPVGVVAAVTLPSEEAVSIQMEVARGLEAACRRVDTHVIGGDTNIGDQLTITATAVGIVPGGVALTRRGASPGELVYCSGQLGRGAAVAAKAVFPHLKTPVPPFRPLARLAEASVAARFATSCMDTSDGLFATLDQMARVNGLAFELNETLLSDTDPIALRVMEELGAPLLLAHASLHGEFEIVFTIPGPAQEAFEHDARDLGWRPLLLGQTDVGEGVRLAGLQIPTGPIRDAFASQAPSTAVETVCRLLLQVVD
jgi:thiamine-monophosphate kinase